MKKKPESTHDPRVANIVEALLASTSEPLSLAQIEQAFGAEEGVTRSAIKQALQTLQADYAGRGVELQKLADRWRLQTARDCAPYIQRLAERKPPRYSHALLETLALIAYRQPTTRGDIEDIRGVAVSTHIIRTLEEREWIRIVGHKDVPGRPALYGTTQTFLTDFNLQRLSDLPTLAQLAESELAAPATTLEGDTLDTHMDHTEGGNTLDTHMDHTDGGPLATDSA